VSCILLPFDLNVDCSALCLRWVVDLCFVVEVEGLLDDADLEGWMRCDASVARVS